MGRDVTRELREQVEAYDRCWVGGRPEEIRRFLHPDAVFTGPDFERVARGADACVQSYIGFLGAAKVHDFSTSDYVVDPAGESAVMTYRWTIDYEMGGTRSREKGQDLLVWVRREAQWLIAWRTQRPEPAAVPSPSDA
jgi:ketosteroid isomerase-like protein